ncbi:unnamed protein product [Ambrosiozyma monospora]|uniref:Unnamed protein product n=1 Tax=Ambrosiozyma monospora TaxID=43982 RepID=A0A9W7DNY0_AMBMO|nr:unnamed protein product [Ambrosiozyma monospora]
MIKNTQFLIKPVFKQSSINCFKFFGVPIKTSLIQPRRQQRNATTGTSESCNELNQIVRHPLFFDIQTRLLLEEWVVNRNCPFGEFLVHLKHAGLDVSTPEDYSFYHHWYKFVMNMPPVDLKVIHDHYSVGAMKVNNAKDGEEIDSAIAKKRKFKMKGIGRDFFRRCKRLMDKTSLKSFKESDFDTCEKYFLDTLAVTGGSFRPDSCRFQQMSLFERNYVLDLEKHFEILKFHAGYDAQDRQRILQIEVSRHDCEYKDGTVEVPHFRFEAVETMSIKDEFVLNTNNRTTLFPIVMAKYPQPREEDLDRIELKELFDLCRKEKMRYGVLADAVSLTVFKFDKWGDHDDNADGTDSGIIEGDEFECETFQEDDYELTMKWVLGSLALHQVRKILRSYRQHA